MNSGNVANASLLRRFNQHSTMVLKAGVPTSVDTTENGLNGVKDISMDAPPSKKVSMRVKNITI